MTPNEQPPTPADPPRDRKLSQREQLAVYFGFADEPGRTAPLTEEERSFVQARRISGVLVAGLIVGLLWIAAGAIPAVAVAVIGAIWFGSALQKYGRR